MQGNWRGRSESKESSQGRDDRLNMEDVREERKEPQMTLKLSAWRIVRMDQTEMRNVEENCFRRYFGICVDC